MNAYQQLESLFKTLNDLEHLQAIAGWDEAVMMPPGGGSARATALATLQSICHQKLTDKKVAQLINQAKELPLDEWQQSNLTLIEKKYKNATCLDSELVETLAQTAMLTEQAWRNYRVENNWKDFSPLLAKNIELSKRSADIRADIFGKSPYDILIDDFSPGINQAIIDPIFNKLKAKLPALISQVVEKQSEIQLTPIQGPFAIAKQQQLGLTLMRALGFDFNHGRLDVSHHPFCGGVPSDVRITTRYNEAEFITALMGICHETGHARYEQGLPERWASQPVGRANGMSLHESQSLLVEMQACRSLEFMHFLEPIIKEHFGDQKAFNKQNLYHLYTEVKPGFIRVDADEVTYPLHVILRYEIEKALFNDEISVQDLPGVWNEKMSAYLNLNTTGNFKEGVMQDVHWAAGLFGYFPAYTLGSLVAAQLFASATKAHPNILAEIQQGNFSPLFTWLNKNIHQRASSASFSQLLQDATGSKLEPEFFLTHVKNRYLAD